MTEMAFPIVSLGLAVGNLVLWGFVLCMGVGDWQRYHDERSARGVLMAMVLVAASVGSTASALGFLLTSVGAEDLDIVAFLAAAARTAMLAGGVAYVVAIRHHKGEG